MKKLLLISGMIVAFVILPCHAQDKVSQENASIVLSNVNQRINTKFPMKIIQDFKFESPEDKKINTQITELRKKLLTDVESSPTNLIPLVTSFLNSEKDLLRAKSINIYHLLNRSQPVTLQLANQRTIVKIKSSNGAFEFTSRQDVLLDTLAKIIEFERINRPASMHRTFKEKFTCPGLDFTVEFTGSNAWISMAVIASKQNDNLSLGKKKKNETINKPNTENTYLFTLNNLRAWYLQLAEMNPRTKAAPALKD